MGRRRHFVAGTKCMKYSRNASGRRNRVISYVPLPTASTTTSDSPNGATSSSACAITPSDNVPGANMDCEPAAAGTSSSTYNESRTKVAQKWEELRKPMLVCHVAEMSPATHQCQKCACPQENIIHCEDCGPNAYYCTDCCLIVHETCSLHVPCQWQGFSFK